MHNTKTATLYCTTRQHLDTLKICTNKSWLIVNIHKNALTFSKNISCIIALQNVVAEVKTKQFWKRIKHYTVIPDVHPE